jgi:mannose-6-phosphate isomerase-like protein (cupin superfamily)
VDAIKWSRFALYNVEDSDLDTAADKVFPFIEGSRYRAVNTGINEPACQINFEDFYPGPDIVWTLSHDEIHYVTKGRAEITYHLPPLMKETGTVIAETGSVYLIPRGCRIVWRVLGDEPFRHLCICPPNPGYPSGPAPSVASR